MDEEPSLSGNRFSIVDSAWDKKFTTKSGANVTIVSVPKMGLIVVSDCDNLGPDWVRVLYKGGVYTTNYLLGGREDVVCPIARHFAQHIIKPEAGGDIDGPADAPEQELLLSISLRKTDPNTVREIAGQLTSAEQSA